MMARFAATHPSRLVCVAWVALIGCGGVTESDGSGGAGSGGAGSGGAGSGGAGSGGAEGTDDCPPAVVARLFPVIGPFWFGPDPGPCSAEPNDVTYDYEGDLLTSSTTGGGETYVRDAASRLVEIVSADGPTSYAYDGHTVTETRSTHSVVYSLSPTGYPLRADVKMAGSTAISTHTYTYQDCRLVLRDAPGAQADRTYEYDDQGHLIAIIDGSSATTFAYDCW